MIRLYLTLDEYGGLRLYCACWSVQKNDSGGLRLVYINYSHMASLANC